MVVTRKPKSHIIWLVFKSIKLFIYLVVGKRCYKWYFSRTITSFCCRNFVSIDRMHTFAAFYKMQMCWMNVQTEINTNKIIFRERTMLTPSRRERERDVRKELWNKMQINWDCRLVATLQHIAIDKLSAKKINYNSHSNFNIFSTLLCFGFAYALYLNEIAHNNIIEWSQLGSTCVQFYWGVFFSILFVVCLGQWSRKFEIDLDNYKWMRVQCFLHHSDFIRLIPKWVQCVWLYFPNYERLNGTNVCAIRLKPNVAYLIWK